MSSFMFCFCCFISWQRSIILAAVTVFPSAGSGDCAWTGDQMASAKANARPERMARAVFVWFFMFCRFPYDVRRLSTAASRLALRLSTGGRGQKLLPAVVAAKVERLSIAFGVESGCFIHGHSADGVFGHGFRFLHGHVSFLVVVVIAL